MGIVFRQSVKSTISIFTGALLGALALYLSTLFIPKQEFGFRSTLTNYAVIAGQILLLGVHNMISVYIHRYDDNDKRKSALLSISLVTPAIFIFIGSVFYFLLRDPILTVFEPQDIPLIKRYFFWLPVFTLLFAYSVVLEFYLTSQMQVAKAVFIREVLLRILNIFLIILFGYGLISFDVLIYGTVLAYLVPIAFMLFIAMGTKAFRITFNWNIFNKKEKKEIIHFTWYHSLLSISVNLIDMLGALMLAVLSPMGLSSVPVYAVSVFIISFLLIPYKAMLQSTFPVLTQSFKEDSMEKAKDIFARSSMNIFLASVAMFLLVICNIHNAVALLPKEYENVAPVVIILALGRMVDLVTGMNDQVLSISKYYKYNFYISLILVVMMLLFNWGLIPIYDVYGAALGTSIAFVLYNVIKLFVVKKMLGFQPLTQKTLLVAAAGVITFFIGYYLPRISNPFADTFYRSVSILIVYSILLLLLKPSKDLNTYLISVRKNKRLF